MLGPPRDAPEPSAVSRAPQKSIGIPVFMLVHQPSFTRRRKGARSEVLGVTQGRKE